MDMKLMWVVVMILLTVFTYGANILLYRFFKKRPDRDPLERLATYFGMNMTVLMADGVFLFVAKMVENLVMEVG